MLGALWLLSLGVTGTWGIWSGNRLLTLTAVLALLFSASLLLWRRWCLVSVHYRRHLSVDRAFFGDTIELRVELTNLKPLPLTWLRVEDTLPHGLHVEGSSNDPDSTDPSNSLTVLLAMLPYQCVVRRMRLHCDRRGAHVLGPAILESGDYLGALSNGAAWPDTDRLIVYPKIFPVRLGQLPSNQLLGRHAASRRMLTDPLRTIGTREYLRGDPYRSIDWRATARHDTIIVRMFEPSTTPILDIVVNFLTATQGWSHWETDGLEFAISVAASLASYGAGHGWAIGLRANGQCDNALIDHAPSAAPAQLRAVLESLARASTRATGPLAPLLARPDARFPSGTTLLLITTTLDRAMLAALLDQHRRGRPVLVLHVAPAYAATPGAPFPILRIEHDAHWMERDALVLGH